MSNSKVKTNALKRILQAPGGTLVDEELFRLVKKVFQSLIKVFYFSCPVRLIYPNLNWLARLPLIHITKRFCQLQQDRSAESLVLKKFVQAVNEIPLIDYNTTTKTFTFVRFVF